MLAAVPEAPRRHLEAACKLSHKHHRDVHWEVRCICQSLSPLKVPIILLKGAAYVVSGLPAARGRIFRDIDVMVPRERLDEVELRLLHEGWLWMNRDAYDQHYYRTWTHQLPPMIHHRRMVSLDVHHTIVPVTARPKVDVQALRDASLPLEAKADLRVLAPSDMVLHSATHLFNEGEFSHGLRGPGGPGCAFARFRCRPGVLAKPAGTGRVARTSSAAVLCPTLPLEPPGDTDPGASSRVRCRLGARHLGHRAAWALERWTVFSFPLCGQCMKPATTAGPG